MPKSGCRIFTTVMRFGDFELDCATAELYKNGRRLKLQDQPARLLVLLASRAGTLVTRADIQETLWADGQFVEFEHAINVAVKKIREALDDDPLKPRFIETVPKKGYRFIGAIDVEPAPPPQPVSVATEPVVRDEEILEREFALPAARARILFIAVQAVYLTIYGLALLHMHDVAAVLGEAGIPWLAVPVLVGAAASIPVRLYLVFTVGLGHPAAGMKYRRMLPYLMPWDWLWAPSPFLAIESVGAERALVMSILLAYPPISQLILMRSIDHPKNRRNRQSAAAHDTVANRR